MSDVKIQVNKNEGGVDERRTEDVDAKIDISINPEREDSDSLLNETCDKGLWIEEELKAQQAELSQRDEARRNVALVEEYEQRKKQQSDEEVMYVRGRKVRSLSNYEVERELDGFTKEMRDLARLEADERQEWSEESSSTDYEERVKHEEGSLLSQKWRETQAPGAHHIDKKGEERANRVVQKAADRTDEMMVELRKRQSLLLSLEAAIKKGGPGVEELKRTLASELREFREQRKAAWVMSRTTRSLRRDARELRKLRRVEHRIKYMVLPEWYAEMKKTQRSRFSKVTESTKKYVVMAKERVLSMKIVGLFTIIGSIFWFATLGLLLSIVFPFLAPIYTYCLWLLIVWAMVQAWRLGWWCCAAAAMLGGMVMIPFGFLFWLIFRKGKQPEAGPSIPTYKPNTDWIPQDSIWQEPTNSKLSKFEWGVGVAGLLSLVGFVVMPFMGFLQAGKYAGAANQLIRSADHLPKFGQTVKAFVSGFFESATCRIYEIYYISKDGDVGVVTMIGDQGIPHDNLKDCVMHYDEKKKEWMMVKFQREGNQEYIIVHRTQIHRLTDSSLLAMLKLCKEGKKKCVRYEFDPKKGTYVPLIATNTTSTEVKPEAMPEMPSALKTLLDMVGKAAEAASDEEAVAKADEAVSSQREINANPTAGLGSDAEQKRTKAQASAGFTPKGKEKEEEKELNASPQLEKKKAKNKHNEEFRLVVEREFDSKYLFTVAVYDRKDSGLKKKELKERIKGMTPRALATVLFEWKKDVKEFKREDFDEDTKAATKDMYKKAMKNLVYVYNENMYVAGYPSLRVDMSTFDREKRFADFSAIMDIEVGKIAQLWNYTQKMKKTEMTNEGWFDEESWAGAQMTRMQEFGAACRKNCCGVWNSSFMVKYKMLILFGILGLIAAICSVYYAYSRKHKKKSVTAEMMINEGVRDFILKYDDDAIVPDLTAKGGILRFDGEQKSYQLGGSTDSSLISALKRAHLAKGEYKAKLGKQIPGRGFSFTPVTLVVRENMPQERDMVTESSEAARRRFDRNKAMQRRKQVKESLATKLAHEIRATIVKKEQTQNLEEESSWEDVSSWCDSVVANAKERVGWTKNQPAVGLEKEAEPQILTRQVVEDALAIVLGGEEEEELDEIEPAQVGGEVVGPMDWVNEAFHTVEMFNRYVGEIVNADTGTPLCSIAREFDCITMPAHVLDILDESNCKNIQLAGGEGYVIHVTIPYVRSDWTVLKGRVDTCAMPLITALASMPRWDERNMMVPPTGTYKIKIYNKVPHMKGQQSMQNKTATVSEADGRAVMWYEAEHQKGFCWSPILTDETPAKLIGWHHSGARRGLLCEAVCITQESVDELCKIGERSVVGENLRRMGARPALRSN